MSQRLRHAIKTSPFRQYQLAHVVQVHPTTLSAWVNGIYAVREGDPRVLKLAELLGVPPGEAFEERGARDQVAGGLR